MTQLNPVAREVLAQALDYHERAAENARGEQQRAQAHLDDITATVAHHELRVDELRQTLREAGEQPLAPGHLPVLG